MVLETRSMPTPYKGRGGIVRLTWRCIGRIIPYPILVKAIAYVVRPLHLRAKRARLGGDLSVERLSAVVRHAPPRLAQAVDNRGAIRTLQPSLLRYYRFALPAVLSACMTEDLGSTPYLTVTGTSHLERAAAGGPVVVVFPHVGPWQLIQPWLLSRGYRVATFDSSSNQRAIRLFFRPRVTRRLVQILVDDRLAAARVAKTTQDGYLFCWGGDATIGYSASTQRVFVDYMGRQVGVTPFTFNLQRLVKPTFVFAVARLYESRSPTIELQFEALDPPADLAGHVTAVYSRIEREILANHGQWSLWRVLDSGGALGGTDASR